MSEEKTAVLGDNDTYTFKVDGFTVSQLLDTHILAVELLIKGGAGDDSMVAQGVFRNIQMLLHHLEEHNGEVDPNSVLAGFIRDAKNFVALGSGGAIYPDALTAEDLAHLEEVKARLEGGQAA